MKAELRHKELQQADFIQSKRERSRLGFVDNRPQIASQTKLIQYIQKKENKYPVLQASWAEVGEQLFKWDTSIKGLQWYRNSDGLMYYEIIDKSSIDETMSHEIDRWSGLMLPEYIWRENGLWNEGDEFVEYRSEPIDITDMHPYKTSNFKTFYLIEGQLLSVFKTEDRKQNTELDEVGALNLMRSKGLPAISSNLVKVQDKGKVRWGVLMDFIEGTFVDIQKMAIKHILVGLKIASKGAIVDITESGNIFLRKKVATSSDYLSNLKKGLQPILELAQNANFVILDMQLIVNVEGFPVIIDPQWAGTFAQASSAQQGLISQAYGLLSKILEDV